MSYLGIDIGTSGCKAVVFENDGTMLGSAYQGYSVLTPEPGFAELDSDEVIKKCFSVIKSAVADSKGSLVAAISISSQGEAFTPVGKSGEFLGNAMVSSDERAEPLLQKWIENFGLQKLYTITGHTPSAMFTLFKLAWLKKNRPEIWEKTHSFYCFEDLLHFKFGITPAIGWSLAGRTMLFDIKKHCWSQEILNTLDLNKSKLATPLPSGATVGVIPKKTAKSLGLPSGVKVISGGHDQTICALGAGVVESGTGMFATGTVDCICPVIDELTLSENLQKNNFCCYDYSLPGKRTTVAYCLTGGNLLQWFKDEFGEIETILAEKEGLDPYDLLLDNIPDKPTSLLALPYFTPSGTPFFDRVTKGTILGLRLSTSRQEILKALLEAVILEMKLNLQLLSESGIKINKLTTTGGGAKNLKWLQLKADILNIPILHTELEEAGCFGAAMLAYSNNSGKSVNEIFTEQNIKVRTITPNPKYAMIYEKKFRNYKKIYPELKKLYLNFD